LLASSSRLKVFAVDVKTDLRQPKTDKSIRFADCDITPPSIGPITVEDHGTIEFHLSFTKQG
jgi:hypothetical protein